MVLEVKGTCSHVMQNLQDTLVMQRIFEAIEVGCGSDKERRGRLKHAFTQLSDCESKALAFISHPAQVVGFLSAAASEGRREMAGEQANGGAQDVADVSLVEYNIEPLSSAEFLVDAPIEPIVILPALWRLTQFAPGVLPPAVARVGTPAHGLSKLVCTFVENRKSGTRSIDGLHGRDDSLMDIICRLAGLKLERNTVEFFPTKHLNCSGMYVALPGSPPLVYVVEKAQAAELGNACTELAQNFCALPHYDPRLEFVVGVALAGDLICFGRLPLCGDGGFVRARTFNIAHDVAQRILCVHAAVNVGRWAHHAVAGCFVEPVDVSNWSDAARARAGDHIPVEDVIVKR